PVRRFIGFRLCISPVFLFFFQLLAAARALHSFPTRRSSDLALVSASLFDAVNGIDGRLQPIHVEADAPRYASERAAAVQAARSEDRKSTRLNSSHDQISYAVFCLKKKTCPAAAGVKHGPDIR